MIIYNFDLRDEYDLVKSSQQGTCNMCWAIAVSDCLSDRYRIKGNMGNNERIDIMDIAKRYSCNSSENKCDYCLASPYLTVIDFCIRTGCISDLKNRYKPIGKKKLTHDEALHELYYNGPVMAVLMIYVSSDERSLYNYKSGIYGIDWWINSNIPKKKEGYHIVTIVGWGVEDDIDYWIVRNSWGMKFGDKGTFKILRRVNCCEIEDDLYSILI